MGRTGQARKSLWIETLYLSGMRMRNLVRLVRACGSKRFFGPSSGTLSGVRLVRACGSKPFLAVGFEVEGTGQARKSLWIETQIVGTLFCYIVGQARKSLWIETYWPEIELPSA